MPDFLPLTRQISAAVLKIRIQGGQVAFCLTWFQAEFPGKEAPATPDLRPFLLSKISWRHTAAPYHETLVIIRDTRVCRKMLQRCLYKHFITAECMAEKIVEIRVFIHILHNSADAITCERPPLGTAMKRSIAFPCKAANPRETP